MQDHTLNEWVEGCAPLNETANGGSNDTKPISSHSRSKDSDHRGTPADIIRRLQDAIGGTFDLDPAAGAEPIKIADRKYTPEDNGLAQPWNAVKVFLNPPYSNPLPWFKKLDAELDRPDGPSLIIALVRGDVSTTWFQEYATRAKYLCAYEGRISFVGADDNTPFGNFLLAFGEVPESVVEAFNDLGTAYYQVGNDSSELQSRLPTLETEKQQCSTADQCDDGFPFESITPYDEIEVEFSQSGLGINPALPKSATVSPLPNGRSLDPETETVTLQCLGANELHSGGDLFVDIREQECGEIVVAVSIDGEPWEIAPATDMQVIERGSAQFAPLAT
jgi:phage N-6-adenine-methyltransferase